MGESPFSPRGNPRLPDGPSSRHGEPRLSQREAEILDLLGEGLTNKQIAERLVVSESTVRTHIYRILEKLDFDRRHDAVAYAIRRRLNSGDAPAGSDTLDDDRQQTAPSRPPQSSGAFKEPGQAAPQRATGYGTAETGIPAGGERKQATALLIRVDCFDATREPMDPDRLEEILPECLDLMSEEIRHHAGIVAWRTAEGMVALFGVPLSTEHAPHQALMAALAILRCHQECTEDLKRKGVSIDLRIGVNSGPVQVEKSADGLTAAYVPIGDTTKLATAARDLARPGTILLTQNTYDLTRRYFDFRPGGTVRLRGPLGPVTTYRLLGAKVAGHGSSSAPSRSLPRFVGRAPEMETLVGAFARTSSGSGQVVGIVGEAGVGKSRLVMEFRQNISKQDFYWLQGSCRHYGGHVAYLPLLEVLHSFFDIGPEEPESIVRGRIEAGIGKMGFATPATLLPPLHDILSLRVEVRDYLKLEPSQKRERIFEAIRSLILQQSSDAPTVLAIDDLQWIDKTSEEFLGYLMNSLAHSRILLLLLYRPEYVHGWSSKSIYSQIRVDELSARNSAQFIHAILGEVSPQLCRYVTDRARGNPLFIEEFINTLREEKAILKSGSQYLLCAESSTGKIPHSIQGIIQSRIDRLQHGHKQAMQVASVIGPEFSYNTLQAVTGMGRELKAHLLDLQESDFIYEKGLSPEPEYVFKHNLIREISYSSLVAGKRWEFHEKVGEALERLYRNRLEMFYEVLAHHYSRSRNADKAYRYLELSAAKASRNYSNWEAFRLGKEAIKMLDRLPATNEIRRKGVEARIQLEGSMRLLAYPEDSWDILEEGARLAEEIGDRRSLAVFYSSLGLCCTFRGEPTRGIEYSARCIDEAEKAEDAAILATVGFDLCSAYAFTGDYLKTVGLAPRITGLLERLHREHDAFGGPFAFNLYCALCVWHGHAQAFLGDFKACHRILDKATHFAGETGSLHTMAFAELMYGLSMVAKGDGQVAVEHLLKAVECGEQGGIIPVLTMSHTALGWALSNLGELDAALRHMKKSFDLRNDSGFTGMLSMSHYQLALIQLESGDLDSAGAAAEQAMTAAVRSRDRWVEAAAGLVLGAILVKKDRANAAAAEKHILDGMAIARELGLRPFQARGHLCLGELYAATGQRKKALDNLRMARAAFEEMGMQHFLHETRKAMEKMRSSRT
jgi:class 3 adenylate cyclase/DNA-binding CsgD family transcriptional regulator/tetratricopeptide (TPR) repeat protein